MATPYYKIEMTVLEQAGVYGNQIDITKDVEITDYIRSGGVSQIKTEADDGEFAVGLFTVGNLTLTAVNYDGKFSDQTDWRSLFPYSRDLAKVTIIYVDSTGAENVRFKGLTTEEGTKEDILGQTVKIKVLSQEGILRKSIVKGGVVRAGMTFKTAMVSILNRAPITDILNVSESNINPVLNLTVDDPGFFDSNNAFDAMNELLQASNSVLVIDSSDNVIVRSRAENSNTPFGFYNGNDYFGRENIVALKNYNSGLQRAFNTIKVGDFGVTDDAYVTRYQGRQKTLNFDFITTRSKSIEIANAIVDEFKVPREEMEITTQTELVKDLVLFDRCTIDFLPRMAERTSEDIAVYDQALYGDAYYPYEKGNLNIDAKKLWKITAIRENPGNYTTQLRLRHVGTIEGEGWLS